MKKIIAACIVLTIVVLLASSAFAGGDYHEIILSRCKAYDGQVSGSYLFTEEGITVYSGGQYTFIHDERHENGDDRAFYIDKVSEESKDIPDVFRFMKGEEPLEVRALFREVPGKPFSAERRSDDGTLLVLPEDYSFCVWVKDKYDNTYLISFLKKGWNSKE